MIIDFCHDSAKQASFDGTYCSKSWKSWEFWINCVDFCHDSAITKQALMALTAPKIEKSWEFWSNCVNNRIKFAVCWEVFVIMQKILIMERIRCNDYIAQVSNLLEKAEAAIERWGKWNGDKLSPVEI